MKKIFIFWSVVMVLALGFTGCASPAEDTVQEEVITAANVSLSGLRVSPSVAQLNQEVTIMVEVSNFGGTAGTYPLVVAVDGVQKISEIVTVADKTIKTFNYAISINKGGTYNVTVGDLETRFTVLP